MFDLELCKVDEKTATTNVAWLITETKENLDIKSSTLE